MLLVRSAWHARRRATQRSICSHQRASALALSGTTTPRSSTISGITGGSTIMRTDTIRWCRSQTSSKPGALTSGEVENIGTSMRTKRSRETRGITIITATSIIITTTITTAKVLTCACVSCGVVFPPYPSSTCFHLAAAHDISSHRVRACAHSLCPGDFRALEVCMWFSKCLVAEEGKSRPMPRKGRRMLRTQPLRAVKYYAYNGPLGGWHMLKGGGLCSQCAACAPNGAADLHAVFTN